MKIKFSNFRTDNEQDRINRKITIPSAAFGLLREDIIKNIGYERMKGFLVRYGWNLGVTDAEEVLQQKLSIEDMAMKGPELHSLNGHIDGIEVDDYEVQMDPDLTLFKATGKWINSYEAAEHVKRFGISDQPVCHTLTGYASGYLSTICNQKLLAKEFSCVGKGDSSCTWEVRLMSNWGEEIQSELSYYSETSILKELEITYEELVEQKNYIMKVSEFHRQLTESISNGSNLQTITDIAFDLIHIPVTIEGLNFHTIAYSGMTEAEFKKIDDDFKQDWLLKNDQTSDNEMYSPRFKNLEVECRSHKRLLVPVQVEKKIIGYCTFIYFEPDKRKAEEDFILLERTAIAASLVLLNEKTSTETFERMKGTFLDQILTQEISSKEEISKRGSFIGFNVNKPYFIISLGYPKNSDNILKFNNDVFEAISSYFSNERKNILIGQREGDFVLMISVETLKKKSVLGFLTQLIEYLEKKFSPTKFKMGVSHFEKNIELAPALYEESRVALKMYNNEKICFFEELGIVGVLVGSNNVSAVINLARHELGSLFRTTNPKEIDLIKTLYVFLQNSGKLEQTMKDLSLSKSGLLYRLKRIEKITGKDLRNPKNIHHLFLTLESLVAIGEIEI